MSSVQSIERAFAILEALAAGPAGVTELADLISLPKSTVARILGTLDTIGAVERVDQSTDFRIGPGLANLAGVSSAAANMIVAVRPVIEKLASEIGEAAEFSVPEGYLIRYLIQVESPNPVQVRDYTGLLSPLHVVPAGLCVMAQWPQEELERYLARPLEAYTAKTETRPGEIRKRLDVIREFGWAWQHEEFAEGISSVAAPVFDQLGRIAGALTVHGPAYRFPGSRPPDETGRTVSEAARRFSVRARTPDEA
jgi:DNA-binding IclR family transcriptional regulator